MDDTANVIDIEDDDVLVAIAMQDELLFLLMFWGESVELETSVEQKMMICDRSDKVLVCTGRKIAKTIAVEAKILQYAINHVQSGTGVTEAMMFTPQNNQLTPTIDRIMSRIYRTPWFEAFLTDVRRGESPRLGFATGLVWYFRIEGVDGSDRNMVGLRAAFILGDEMAFGNENTHTSRIQTALPNCRWWYSGVPNGLRASPFYRLDMTDAGKTWSRHKYATFVNPLYASEKKKQELEDDYGGRNTQGYITQVLGMWGDEVISSFPSEAIAIGTQPYYYKQINTKIRNEDQAVGQALSGLVGVRAKRFAIGWDYGFSPDPSMIIIALSREDNKWECYARIELRQIVLPVQARFVRYLYRNILQGSLGAISCDSADAIQTLQSDDPEMAVRFYNVKPGGMMPMVDENGTVLMARNEKTGHEEPVMIFTKQYLTEKLRGFMIAKKLDLPGIQLVLGNDNEVVEELTGTTEAKTVNGRIVYYGPPDNQASGKMKDHNTDALRFLSDAILRSVDRVDESESEALAAMGWVGKGSWSPRPEPEVNQPIQYSMDGQ